MSYVMSDEPQVEFLPEYVPGPVGIDAHLFIKVASAYVKEDVSVLPVNYKNHTSVQLEKKAAKLIKAMNDGMPTESELNGLKEAITEQVYTIVPVNSKELKRRTFILSLL